MTLILWPPAFAGRLVYFESPQVSFPLAIIKIPPKIAYYVKEL